ncbi:hypothetical protein WSK_1468 [Novosphingobium sp. Rr 2-17]|nr:hypothetical protein WSK_1468 [Novosphingobium sp. Rr 2-17]
MGVPSVAFDTEALTPYPTLVIASPAGARQSRASLNRPGLLRYARNDEGRGDDDICGHDDGWSLTDARFGQNTHIPMELTR